VAQRRGSVATDIKYKLADYDGGLESHPVPESDGQLWLVGSWWELHFAHVGQFVNGELTDYVLEASRIDKRSCLISIRDSGRKRRVRCSFVLPRTPADRFTSDLARRLRELAADRAGIADLGLRPADVGTAARDVAAVFPVRMEMTVGDPLEVVPADAAPSRSEFGLTGVHRLTPFPTSAHHSYEVFAPSGRVAALGLGGQAGLAWMACVDGSWRLNKRRPLGWELVIESWDGHTVGSYSGRRWVPGGTISLIAGTPIDLRRALGGHWKLRIRDAQDCFVDIRTSKSRQGLRVVLTIRSEPPSTSQAIIATLTACAVVLLEHTSPRLPSAGGGG
jgi:hypothetical protein